LRSPHFALLASFLHRAFLAKNRRAIPYQELIDALEHHLQDIADSHGPELFPKSARAYVDDWINSRGGYLRKYLPLQSDEPECDLLPEIEKALRWIEEMQGRRFVGTESRLKLLLELIGDLVHGTTEDGATKLATLRARKAEIEQAICAVELGQDTGMSATQIRERLFFLGDLSRQLLGDFRQVEANFRSLDKETRKTITRSGLQKGLVLDQVFGDQDVIDSSDEGQSFSAFFELLMTPQMRSAMRHNLQSLLAHEEARNLVQQDTLLSHLYSYLLEAGAKVNLTRQQITDQLRRYIQEQSQDNKRILELIRDFEAQAHRLEELDSRSYPAFAQLPEQQATLSMLLSRGLYHPPRSEQFSGLVAETAPEAEVDLRTLFEVSHIDEQQLQHQIHRCLSEHQGQVTLAQVIERYPIRHGLDEVLTYIKLACEQTLPAHIDTTREQQIRWQAEPELWRLLRIPAITFVREL
jgi:hypothetical protein